MNTIVKKNKNINKKEELEILSPKSDFIFKLIFGDEKRIDLLADFLLSILNLPKEELGYIQITDPHIKKESIKDKYGILDVKLYTKNKDIIDIEIQVLRVPYLKDRVVFYNSKMINEQLSRGDNHELKRAISIIITDFDLIPESKQYLSTFTLREKDSGIEFTNITEINVIELNKLPEKTDHTKLWEWLKFLKVETKEELKMISKENSKIKKAAAVLVELSEDEETRLLEESREKARLDRVWGLRYSYNQGKKEGVQEGEEIGIEKGEERKAIEIAKELLIMKLPEEQVSAVTKLSLDKVRVLSC